MNEAEPKSDADHADHAVRERRAMMAVSKQPLHQAAAAETDHPNTYAHLTPTQRLELVGELSRSAYAFTPGAQDARTRLPRHAWRVVVRRR